MTYRVSALGRAALSMWRAWRIVVPVVLVNAVVQALLVWPQGMLSEGAIVMLLAVLSAVAFLGAYGFIGAAALLIPQGPVRWASVRERLTGTFAPYAMWALILLVITAAGMALHRGVPLLVHALTAFVLLAALDGQRNPFAANFRTIGRRLGRWLVTAAITSLVLAVGIVIAGVTMFFLRGALGAFVVWVVAGVIVAWLTTAWALIYLHKDPAPDEAEAMPKDPDLAGGPSAPYPD
jgi:hypothetical protein